MSAYVRGLLQNKLLLETVPRASDAASHRPVSWHRLSLWLHSVSGPPIVRTDAQLTSVPSKYG